MLNAAQLASMQAFAARTLDLTANTTRNTATGANVWGTPNETWTAMLTGVACGLSEPTPKQMQVYATLIGSPRAWIVSFPFGSDVKRDDRISVNGTTMRAQIDISLGSYSTLTQVLAVTTDEVIA